MSPSNGEIKRSLSELESLMGELRVLMSSFNPDSKLAELIRQAMMKAHSESILKEKVQTCITILFIILVLVFLFGVANILNMWWLAE